ncbi:MAG: transposase [Patescibacteria group bacterium]
MHPLGRRSIRLQEYDYRSDGAYFVTICTFNRKRSITESRKLLLKHELKALEVRFQGLHLDFYIFMANHIHVIFTFRNVATELSKVVQTYKSRTTIGIRKGGYTAPKFWQRNYYERVIRNQEELNVLREYIRLNPEQERFDFQEILRQKGRASSTPTAL